MTDADSERVFLFTDIESSTRLWEEHREAMRAALALHDAMLRDAVTNHGGSVFKTVGDGICAAFARAADAVQAAVAAQRALAAAAWPAPVGIRVRMALHAGEAEQRDDDYFGPALNRAARLLAAGHGGQVLASLAVRDRVASSLAPAIDFKPLGRHRLRDLAEAETIFQVVHPELPGAFPELRTLETHPHNLPRQLTRFIGRERDVWDIASTLESERLVTVSGTAGCGKTRVCLHAAAEALPRFPAGVWLVELAAVADGALVPAAASDVLGLREEPGCSLTESVARHIRSRRTLLLLDNCEHLLGAVGVFATTLLARCPELRILVTSREALGVPGELTIRIPSLAVPVEGRTASPADLRDCESAQMLIDRVRLVRPDFRLTAANAPAVASICRRLDGIPFAIELAAARLRSLSVEEVDQRLDDRFRLLTGGSRVALPRHRTLRALIDWSYDLLSPAERRVLQRVSVFAGGWTLEAAEAVCGDSDADATRDGGASDDAGMSDDAGASDHAGASDDAGTAADGRASAAAPIARSEVLDLLTALVDRSLVTAGELDGRTRYRLLETVRQYARDRLLEAGIAPAAWRRFAHWFRGLAERASAHLVGADQAPWIRILQVEHENLRGALTWSRGEEPDTLVAIAGGMARFWYVAGHLSDGRRWLDEAIRLSDGRDDMVRARLLLGASSLARDQGDFDSAESLAAGSLAMYRRLASRAGEGESLHNLALIAGDRGDSTHAEALYRQSMAICLEVGNRRGVALALLGLALAAEQAGRFAEAEPFAVEAIGRFRDLRDAWGIASSLNVLGVACCSRGDYPRAAAVHEESLGLQRGLGNRRGIALSLHNLGYVAFCQREFERARGLFRESLLLFDELSDRWGLAVVLASCGLLALETGAPRRAIALLDASGAIASAMGVPHPVGENTLSEGLARARAALGEDPGHAARTESPRIGAPGRPMRESILHGGKAPSAGGAPMTLDEAVALALER